jgi:hypothetical protein
MKVQHFFSTKNCHKDNAVFLKKVNNSIFEKKIGISKNIGDASKSITQINYELESFCLKENKSVESYLFWVNYDSKIIKGDK